ncbi:amino acid/polyamine transporter I [Syncephalastrum racemosum]|uniref:Amino acid/polyamine transporter I n=1 Tax=Syncephalastrum racemosum TaxID=13706 RepID=A0A1X2H5Q7_SYNRA|nr:amino acid/polyamine transporter I [Syncephalastrum racemosum]
MSKDEKLSVTYVDEKVSHTTDSQTTDYDAQRLQELGYKQEFNREISLFVQAGFSFSTMAVLPNWLVGFGGAMASGGPMSLFWGFICVSPFIMCIALAMAEHDTLAYPVNGGVYSWCYLLSSPEWGPMMAWLCGYVFVAGLLSATMTLAYSMGEYVIAIANVLNENQIDNQGANVGLYILFLIVGVAYNYLGLKFSAYLNKFMVIWVTIGTIIVVICMPVMSPTHPSAKWVFTAFTNTAGYQNSGLTFLLGLLQAGWTLIGYECGAQIAEGTKRADVTGPRGIIISVLGAIFQGIILCIATLFSIQDVEELQTSTMPVATLFLRSTNQSLAAFFLVILMVTQFGSLCNSMLASAQMIWSMARDECLPFAKFWYKLHGDRKIPLRILILQAVICTIVIMPSFGSPVYWSAIMSTAVIAVNIAYGMPYFCRLIWKRHDMVKGPFNLGKWSIPISCVAVLWIIFFSIILCFPSVNPVAPETMNWSCLMLGATVLFAMAFWYAFGRKSYKGPLQTIDGE